MSPHHVHFNKYQVVARTKVQRAQNKLATFCHPHNRPLGLVDVNGLHGYFLNMSSSHKRHVDLMDNPTVKIVARDQPCGLKQLSGLVVVDVDQQPKRPTDKGQHWKQHRSRQL